MTARRLRTDNQPPRAEDPGLVSTEAINLASKHCRTDPGVAVSTGQPAAMNDPRRAAPHPPAS